MPEKVKIENNTSQIKGSLEQRKIIVKRKLEVENLKGAIKRLNLDSGASENWPRLRICQEVKKTENGFLASKRPQCVFVFCFDNILLFVKVNRIINDRNIFLTTKFQNFKNKFLNFNLSAWLVWHVHDHRSFTKFAKTPTSTKNSSTIPNISCHMLIGT